MESHNLPEHACPRHDGLFKVPLFAGPNLVSKLAHSCYPCPCWLVPHHGFSWIRNFGFASWPLRAVRSRFCTNTVILWFFRSPPEVYHQSSSPGFGHYQVQPLNCEPSASSAAKPIFGYLSINNGLGDHRIVRDRLHDRLGFVVLGQIQCTTLAPIPEPIKKQAISCWATMVFAVPYWR